MLLFNTLETLGSDMGEFRYYCLYDDGKIALGEYIEADPPRLRLGHSACAQNH